VRLCNPGLSLAGALMNVPLPFPDSRMTCLHAGPEFSMRIPVHRLARGFTIFFQPEETVT